MYLNAQFLCFFFICIKFSIAHQCYFYNETICAGSVEDCSTVEQCNETSLSEDASKCYVLWRIHSNGTLTVKLKGCFISSGIECSEQRECVATGNPISNGLLFCCCSGDLCNQDFVWAPTPSPPPTKEELKKPDHDTVVYIAYVLFSLSLVLFAVIMYLLKKRKIPYFKQIPSLDQRPQSPATPVPDKQRKITFIESIAEGKFGTVWKGYDKGELVAVKRMSAQEKQSWNTEQEIYKLPLMVHDNILRFIFAQKSVENCQTEFWIVTEYHELGSLQDYLKKTTITWEQLCHIAFTMARGLTHLHEEIPSEETENYKPAVAHRDFKSSNVLLKSDLTACIADFGLALIFKRWGSCGDTHGQVGTRRYMAPEILEGAINFSRDSFLRIDMYACGLVLWELASRCSSQQDPVPEYKLPFEEEVGQHPSLEDIQEVVVHKKLRPVIKPSWRLSTEFALLCDTIEECWDHDAEARLSASCVMERISWHTRSSVSPNTSLLYNEIPSENNNNVAITITNSFSST